MAHVTVNYEMFLPGGHHRQPRNVSIDLPLAQPAGGDMDDGKPYTPPFFQQLPYTLPNNGGNGMAQLMFWSVTDGMSGQVAPPAALTQEVNGVPLTITAWYFPISGPAVPGNGTGIIDDAFSANLGQFIDDTFVDVSPDDANHSKTGEANVTGDVDTTNAGETLTAKNVAQSTGEPFNEWILNGVIKPAGQAALQVQKGTDGVAIAIYQQPQQSTQPTKPVINGKEYETWQWVDYGTMVDGGPHPWNPLVNELMRGVALAAAAKGVDKQLRPNLMKVAVAQIKLSSEKLQESIRTAG